MATKRPEPVYVKASRQPSIDKLTVFALGFAASAIVVRGHAVEGCLRIKQMQERIILGSCCHEDDCLREAHCSFTITTPGPGTLNAMSVREADGKKPSAISAPHEIARTTGSPLVVASEQFPV